MTILGAFFFGLGLGGIAVGWLLGNRPDRSDDLADYAETLQRSRDAMAATRHELMLAEVYTAALLDDPAYYVSQRCGPPAKGGA